MKKEDFQEYLFITLIIAFMVCFISALALWTPGVPCRASQILLTLSGVFGFASIFLPLYWCTVEH